ncbi:phosphate acetyl/butaryl transferase family protein [Delftia acidovorans]|jgi:phosphate acetyltransferase|uniref:bifunctional enoyl-CoA hydratase/phosphate acetyltransferase n=1 Tax=Delftia TaxID=80865 RepID=UPI000507A1ED|nr:MULTISPECIES: bifunctional enoyl-CoA hydratase/phosphate acetyltransferase [Delftia]KFJ11735.1 phosphate acetyl/butaryl transferase family protein [Delftia acidovorans]KZK29009.1 phosphate acetyltransferase [Delftia sp. GW456-R20]MBD9581651.1 bifunctional enoyl-CoA hydratase/phosphate acetyltransferase [Delftia sp. DLF01]QQB51490.1 bifunctional enoyl-CoA hydratase/phosphate acetyltransferase [Delftia acidovorans]
MVPPLSLAVAADDAPATHRPHLQHLLDQAKAQGPIPVAVAYPCDAGSLQAAMQAAQAGLITPLLVGPEARIRAAAQSAGLDLAGASIHSTADDPRAAAAQAAALCGSGQARALMKGSLHSDELLGAAVAREAGLRGSRRASHVFVMDLPGFERPLLMTDCVVNIFPTLMDKRDIAQNAIDLARAIGIARPRVAVLSAVETVNPAIPGTIDAAALCKMADRGQISGAILDGPLAYDNAISLRSAHHKGIVSDVAGQPDVLLVPSLEAGNMIYKQLVYMADAECAGLVLGMRVPIVLTSRSDSVASRIASCALAVLADAAGGKEQP